MYVYFQSLMKADITSLLAKTTIFTVLDVNGFGQELTIDQNSRLCIEHPIHQVLVYTVSFWYLFSSRSISKSGTLDFWRSGMYCI